MIFVNIGKVIGASFQPVHTRQPPVEENEDTPVNWKFEDFMESEVFKVVQSINVFKSSGIYAILVASSSKNLFLP